MSAATRWLLAGLLLGGCRGGGGPAPVCDGVAGVAITRVAEHPGGGDEVTVRLAFDNGVPIAEAELIECLSVEGASAPAVVARRPLQTAYTLLLVDPGNNQRANESARGLVQAILKKRPAGEALAIFRWGASVTQVVPFHSDRRLLLERLSAGLVASDGVAAASEALAAAADALSKVGGPATDALRTIILVGPRAAATVGLGEALERARPHLVLAIGGADQDRQLVAALPAGLRFSIGGQTVPAQVVSALSDRMEAYQRHAHYAIGLCGQAEHPVRLVFRGGGVGALTLPPASPENRPGGCQAEAIAQGQRAFPGRVELLFSAEQKAAAAAAFLDRSGRPRFELLVGLGADTGSIRATARYRGDATYGCARRSYSLELESQERRFWFPGSAARRFELQAMCLDRLYLRTFTLLSLLADEGLFPVPFDFIELSIDGVSQGPYLIFEEVTDAMRARASGLAAVVQRRGGGTEVRWSAGEAAAAQASYDRILAGASGLAGRRLETALSDRFDLQGYLTWVALMNLMDSGGYGDESMFYATETTAPDGTRADYHLTMAWDEDDLGDLFTGCRAGGGAIVDPRGLVSCAEAALDRTIFTDPLLYARYTEVLSSVIERHPGERFAARARQAATRVLAVLERPTARAGAVELGAIDPRANVSFEVTRALLEEELALLVSQFEHRRAALDERLARFRGER
jgi:hypothetical protein